MLTREPLAAREVVPRRSFFQPAIRALTLTMPAIVCALCLVGVLVLVVWSTVGRQFGYPMQSVEELSEGTLVLLGFVGAAVAYSRDEHTRLVALTRRLPERHRIVLRALSEWLVVVGSVTAVIISVPLLRVDRTVSSPTLQIAQLWYDLPVPIGMALIAIVALGRLGSLPRRATILSGLGLLSVSLAIWAAESIGGARLTIEAGVFLACVGFLATVLVGVPVAFGFVLSTMFALYTTQASPLSSLPYLWLTGLRSFLLLAIPFFVMAGVIFARRGLVRPVTDLVTAITSRLRGGALHVLVVTTFLFSGVSGSKFADVAAVGLSTRAMVEENGYKPETGAAVLCASAAMGESIPPSIALVVVGSISNLSIGKLFLAGILPAALIALVIMAIIAIRFPRAVRSGSPREGGRGGYYARLIAGSFPIIIVPIIVVGGILSGAGTPTELSSFAALYAVLLALVAGGVRWLRYARRDGVPELARSGRALRLGREAGGLLVEVLSTVGMILFIVGASSGFSSMLSIANVPQGIGHLMTGLAGGKWVFLLLSIVVLILMGLVLEGLPALLIFVPILMPLAPHLGINPIQFAIVMIISMGLGAFLPPIGVGAFVAAGTMGASVERMVRAIVPFGIAVVLGLVLTAAIPWISLAIVGHS